MLKIDPDYSVSAELKLATVKSLKFNLRGDADPLSNMVMRQVVKGRSFPTALLLL